MTTGATTLGELAELVGGSWHGDPHLPIHGAAILSDVEAGQITLVDHADRLKELHDTKAAAVVAPNKLNCDSLPSITVADVHAAFSTIIRHFHPPRNRTHRGISPHAHISPTAKLAPNIEVHAGATIGDDTVIGPGTVVLPGTQILAGCTVGSDCTIGPAAVLYDDTVVGDRTIIQAGVVVGSNGFGFRQADGRHVPMAQLGFVRIGSDVEIGANTTIDRGTYSPTLIGDGTKIDNLVQIAHNCRIGRHNLICSQVGIAGSTSTGDYVVMGGQAGIRDHVHIGKGAVLSAMAGVSNDVPDGAMMMGIPATPEREQKLKQAALAKLPEMRKEFKTLRQTVTELEKTIATHLSNAAKPFDKPASDRAA